MGALGAFHWLRLGGRVVSCRLSWSWGAGILLPPPGVVKGQRFLSKVLCLSGRESVEVEVLLSRRPASSLHVGMWVVSLHLTITEQRALELGSWMMVETVFTSYQIPRTSVRLILVSPRWRMRLSSRLTQPCIPRLSESDTEPKLA